MRGSSRAHLLAGLVVANLYIAVLAVGHGIRLLVAILSQGRIKLGDDRLLVQALLLGFWCVDRLCALASQSRVCIRLEVVYLVPLLVDGIESLFVRSMIPTSTYSPKSEAQMREPEKPMSSAQSIFCVKVSASS